MKKSSFLIVLFLLVTLLFSTSGIAFAQDKNEPMQEKKVVLNEYLYLKQLKEKADKELQAKGLTSKDIQSIRKLDYEKELKERAKLDRRILSNMGYSNEQIEMLRNFRGSEKEIVALAATLTLSARNESLTYISNRTYFRLDYSWRWSSPPMVRSKDIIAMSWSPDMYDTGNITNVYYKNVYVGNSYKESVNVQVGTPGRGSYAKFSVSKNETSYDFDWAYEGDGSMSVMKIGRVPEAQMKISYGHSQWALEPSVSFPSGGSIAFKTGVNEEDFAVVYASLW